MVALPDEHGKLAPGLFNLNLVKLDEYTIACQIVLQDSERFSKLKVLFSFHSPFYISFILFPYFFIRLPEVNYLHPITSYFHDLLSTYHSIYLLNIYMKIKLSPLLLFLFVCFFFPLCIYLHVLSLSYFTDSRIFQPGMVTKQSTELAGDGCTLQLHFFRRCHFHCH
jgi:hypothetical protein